MTGVIWPAVQSGVQPSVGAPGRCLCSTGPPLTPSLALLYLEQGPGRTRDGDLWEHRSKAGKGGAGPYPQYPLGSNRQQWKICTHQQDVQLIMIDRRLHTPPQYCTIDYRHYTVLYCKLFIGSQLSKLK